MTSRERLLIAVCAGFSVAVPAPGWSDAGPKGSETPTAFMSHAAVAGMAEVKLGQLAQEKAASGDVKAIGLRMAQDHGKANEELAQVASKKSVTLPKEIDAKHQALYDKLSKLSGPEFDRAYIDEMLTGHRQVVAEFEQASRSSDPDVRDFASRTLPTIQDHLRVAQEIAAKDQRSAR